MFKNKISIFFILFLFLMCVGFVSASENVTVDIDDANSLQIDEVSFEDAGNFSQFGGVDNTQIETHIETDNVISYYKDKTDFVSYLKDNNNQSIQNKTIKVQIGEKTYKSTTDQNGKITLPLNLKPNNYVAKIIFDGDDDYISSNSTATVKIKKAPLAIKIKNYNNYVHSGLFFKVKVYNSITKNLVSGIKVKFKVYNTKTKKYAYYWATTDKNGVAQLKKNFNIGKYKVSAKVDDSKNKKYISYKSSGKKVTMKVNPTKEIGCCSFYVQVSDTESVGGFRRDGTDAVNIYLKAIKWAGKTAIKQYKTAYGYFSHLIVTSDGWMVGNGGIEDGSMSRAIENIAAKMVKAKKISATYLKQIQKYKKRLNFGHFSIKAPNGKFAIVWQTGYITGKLKPGEFLSSPNFKSYYRHGTYAKYGKDPAKVAIKVGATDGYGVNRRDIIVIHWKATTDKNFKTTSSVKCYAANDNGKLVGRSTAYLKDNIYFKNKFYSKNNLPMSPNMKALGSHSFGNINKLVKTPTIIKAPQVTNQFNKTQYFKVKIKNKATGKVINGVKVKIKFKSSNGTVYYFYAKTDSNGLIKINTKDVAIGDYAVAVMPNNNKYLISAKSTINII